MIHSDIPRPEISPDFTIEDLHKIREWNYGRFKDATPEERREYLHAVSQQVHAEMQALRAKEAA